MDPEVKSEFIRDTKKQITEDCSVRCFSSSNLDENCITTCYDSYLMTINTTTKTLIDQGYLRNSRYISLAYGEYFDEYQTIKRFNQDVYDSGYSESFFELNPRDRTKDF